MTRTMLFAVLLAFPLCVGTNAQTTIFHGKGAYAQSNFPNISLSVADGDAGLGTPQPFLIYSIFVANPDGSYTFGYGQGLIPAVAFTDTSVQHMSLNIDTSQVAGFQAQTCTAAPPDFIYFCTNGPFGIIQINWQHNGNSSSSTKQHLNFVNGPFRADYKAYNDYASAKASGTFFGTNVLDNGSQMGLDHGSTIVVTMGN